MKLYYILFLGSIVSGTMAIAYDNPSQQEHPEQEQNLPKPQVIKVPKKTPLIHPKDKGLPRTIGTYNTGYGNYDYYRHVCDPYDGGCYDIPLPRL